MKRVETSSELFARFMKEGFERVRDSLDVDETVHQSEFRKLVHRVEVLEVGK